MIFCRVTNIGGHNKDKSLEQNLLVVSKTGMLEPSDISTTKM